MSHLQVKCQEYLQFIFWFLHQTHRLISIDVKECILNKFIDHGVSFDIEFVHNIFIVKNSFHNIELLPLKQNFSKDEEEILLNGIILDCFKDVEENCEHVPTVIKRNFFIFDSCCPCTLDWNIFQCCFGSLTLWSKCIFRS